MKLKASLPHVMQTGEDVEEPVITLEGQRDIGEVLGRRPEGPALPADRSDGKAGGRLDIGKAPDRAKEFRRLGLFTRAVVAKWKRDPDEVFDPHNWGIIIEMLPLREFPFHVIWTDGTNCWTDGKDVTVIYKGMIEKDLAAFMIDRKPVNAVPEGKPS